jgi:GT2 family glycosyltransferase
MMTRIPVAGVVWQTLHYLIGLQRLGYDVYYVETHARTPSMLMQREEDDSSAKAAEFISRIMRRFDLGDKWAFLALHDDRRCFGLSRRQLLDLYSSAAVLINLHGGTEPTPELAETGRLVYVETDPVQLQIELEHGHQYALDFLEPHCAFFTFGENYGRPGCILPVSNRFDFHPTRQPVIIDFWRGRAPATSWKLTTVGNWRQPWRDITIGEEIYTWSKHHEFLKFIDLPSRTEQELELALSSYEQEDKRLLERHGWSVRHALDLSTEIDAYRDYIVGSRGEFTVAKDQNVRFRTGWFSDRSATYLAAGRPVVSQDTGFSSVFPTGAGLFGFTTAEEALDAFEQLNGDYAGHMRAASEIAIEYFSHDVVLRKLLGTVGEELGRSSRPTGPSLPTELVLEPVSRRPTRLPSRTVRAVLDRPVPEFSAKPPLVGSKPASVVMVTRDNLVFARMCLESVLGNTADTAYELIVVDNGSADGTPAYLRALAAANPRVKLILNVRNAGFAHACNQGLATAGGDVLVLLNDDTIVSPGWLAGLATAVEDPVVGLAGAVTNRIGNEAEIEVSYKTLAEFLELATRRSAKYADRLLDIGTVTMFCLAMRRDVFERVGFLDQRFEVGMLEDDDYSLRVRRLGLRTVCVEGVLVHHFGETSFGKLVASGEHAQVLATNKRRFEEKWGRPWEPYSRRPKPDYESLTARIRAVVAHELPERATVLVVSRGDDELLELGGREAWHFPQADRGGWAGHHPADSAEAVAQLERLRERGGEFILFPKTNLWWLDHYTGLREHLESRYPAVVRRDDTCVIFALNGIES